MYRTVFLSGMVLFFGLLGVKSIQAQTEVVFSEVTRVTEEFSDCHNEGKTYHLSITGIADGEEKTVGIGNINPSDTNKARNRMADFCEKAALLTKSQPDKYDLYFKSDSRGGGSGSQADEACPNGRSSSGSTIIKLVCELR